MEAQSFRAFKLIFIIPCAICLTHNHLTREKVKKGKNEQRKKHATLNDIKSPIINNCKLQILLASLRRQCGRQFAHFFFSEIEALACNPCESLPKKPTTPFQLFALDVGLTPWNFCRHTSNYNKKFVSELPTVRALGEGNLQPIVCHCSFRSLSILTKK